MKSKLLFPLLLLCSTWITAQNIGLHPPSVNWQQIDTDTVRVIFPTGYEAQAQRVANQIHVLQRDHRRSIGDQYFKFDLILQTQNTVPNAYVGLAPFRSEFFTTPPQSFSLLGTTPWNDLLAIHEFRHVQQNSNERRGLTKIFSYLQGQLGWAVLSSLATPNWFSEGDAVVAETALTTSGRGRLPAFTRGLRAMEQSDIRYSYAKTRNGSYKDRVPSHYPYGYTYNQYARREFGNDVWREVLAKGAAYKPLFYPFSGALKKKTGLTTPRLYTAAMNDLNERMDADLKSRDILETKILSEKHREPTQYLFAHPQADGSVIAYRSTFKRTPELVRIKNGETEVLTSIGIQRESYLDVREGLAVWTEMRNDPRYINRDYSDVILYEIGSGRKRKLTQQGKYLSPSLSANRQQLVAVKYLPEQGAQLVILNTVSGAEELVLPNPEKHYLAWPVFAPDGQTVYAIANDGGELKIIEQAIAGNSQPKVIKRFLREVIDMLTIGPDGKLYYTSNQSGLDNIHVLDPKTGEVLRYTSVATGAYYPGVGPDGSLSFSVTNAQGHHLASNLDTTKNFPVAPDVRRHALTQPLAWSAEGGNMMRQSFDHQFPVKNISDHFGGIKLHSWSYNGSYVQPALEAIAQNALNTVAISATLNYNINEKRSGGGFSLRYGGLYPVLELGGNYRERSVVSRNQNFPDSLVIQGSNFNQLALSAEATIPLTWTAGDFRNALRFRTGYSFIDLGGRIGGDERLPDQLGSLGFAFSFQSLHRQSRRQVQPRFGISTNFFYDLAPSSENLGQRFLLRASSYLPGVFTTHGLRLDFNFQRESLENAYQYPDGMRYVRGYNTPFNDQAVRWSINYQLPLLYPDFGIAGITYFQRIRGNFFYDAGSVDIDFLDLNIAMSSVGVELFFDNSWMNAQELTIGLQLAYILERDRFSPAGASRLRPEVLFTGSF